MRGIPQKEPLASHQPSVKNTLSLLQYQTAFVELWVPHARISSHGLSPTTYGYFRLLTQLTTAAVCMAAMACSANDYGASIAAISISFNHVLSFPNMYYAYYLPRRSGVLPHCCLLAVFDFIAFSHTVAFWQRSLLYSILVHGRFMAAFVSVYHSRTLLPLAVFAFVSLLSVMTHKYLLSC